MLTRTVIEYKEKAMQQVKEEEEEEGTGQISN